MPINKDMNIRVEWVLIGWIVFGLLGVGSVWAEMPLPTDNMQRGTESSQSTAIAPAKNFEPDKSYMLGVGDRINIRIFPEDEYIKGTQMSISSEGNITLPLIGKVAVDGLTVIEAERKMVEIIDRDYLVNPEVVIEVFRTEDELVTEMMNVSILGAVQKPSNYEIPVKGEPVTLIKAILRAGGFSNVANAEKIKIIRKREGGNQVIRANAESIVSGKTNDIPLEDGDIIHVAESLF